MLDHTCKTMAFGIPVSYDAFEDLVAGHSPDPSMDMSPPVLKRERACATEPTLHRFPSIPAHGIAPATPQRDAPTSMPKISLANCVRAMRSMALGFAAQKLTYTLSSLLIISLIRNLEDVMGHACSHAESACIRTCIQSLRDTNANPFVTNSMRVLLLDELSHRLDPYV